MLATNITQYHVDSQSTGADLTETQLTSSNVNAADFGQLYNTPLDGEVYAEPLVMTNVTITAGPNTIGTPGTYNSVVYVATQNDSLYAINAANGAILWQRTFLDTTNPNDALPGATAVTTIPSADVNSDDIYPQIGITGTPVIDPSSNVIYVLPNTEEIVDGNAFYVQRLHAISLSDGTDVAPSFVIGTTTNGNTNVTPVYVSGTGDGNVNGVVQFNALRENNRPALSLVNGEVYAEWASHGDNGPYHGWVVAWNVTNLSTQGMVLSGVLCTDPNGGEGGIWGGGGGLTFDPDETFNGQPAFYFETGNGDPRGGNPPLDGNGFPSDDDYYESLVKVEADPTTTTTSQNSNGWGLKIVDYFTPYNVNALDDADEDFGSGSPLVLPDSAGIPGHPHLIIAAGKEGTIYLIDRDDMGKFNANDDNVLNSVYDPSTGITTPPVLINGSLSTPAYYHGEIYWVSGYNSNAFSYVVAPNPDPDPPTVPVAVLEPTSETANNNFGYVPGSVMISANGDEDPADAVVWIIDTNNGELHAYSALSLNEELWNSGAGSIATVKFAVPTVANGQVFVGTQDSLQVFGLTGTSAPAQAPNAPANLSAQPLSGSSVELGWTDSTVSPNFATNYAIEESTDGIHFTTVANAGQESTSYTVTGLSQSTTYYFQVVGSNSAGSSGPSNIALATTTNQTGATPTAPQGLGATPASGSEVYLTWTNTASNETGFTLTRATDSLFTQNVVTESLASAPFYYTDGAVGLSPGNTYYYQIQATNSSGASSSSNTASVTIPNVPPAPTNAAAVFNGNSIVVSWTDHAGPFALGYQISRSVDGGPYSIYTDRPETSDAPPTTQTFTDTDIQLGYTYTYEIVAENVAGFSAPAYATGSDLGLATLTLDSAGNLDFTASPGVPDQLSVGLTAGIYTLTDPAVTITVTGAGAGFVTGAGGSSVTIPAANVSAMILDTSDSADTIRIISDAVPITITADSGGGDPTINLGDPTNNEVIDGTITNASNGTLEISGAGTTTINGSLICQGLGGVTLAGAGAINITGDIDLGSAGNLVDSATGSATISGAISGTATSGFGLAQGLVGTYFNLPAAQDLIQPADPSNSAWLGNQTPAVTAPLVGPIDFPDIADNGFADSVGDPAYYNLGGGNNNNVAARWYGDIMIPGTGSTPVPIDFATTSDDGSMLYIDGNAVVSNNNFQAATQVTGIADLTPGLHAIDVEYYQVNGPATMDVQWDPTGGNNFVDIPNSAFSSTESANGLKMTGDGTLTLTNTNSYVGATTIDGGTLVVTANGAMGPATATGIFVNAGGALALAGGFNYTTLEPITISGSGPDGNGAIENESGTNAFATPITLSGTAAIGSDAGALTLGGDISAGSYSLTVVGAGATTLNGNITCQGGTVTLAASGAINIAGDIDLGSAGNIVDSGSGRATISGAISGTATSGFGLVQGLVGTYFNLPAGQDLIQPADPGNSAWLGNQTPAVTAPLVGPIDFPDIADNGFADSVGDPAYYNLGGGNNVNVEARWYGNIMIPGTGTTPVPINFATSSDDGSMLYIDGNAVVNNNNYQAVTQATGTANLTPGLHTIDVEYFQGGGGATMDVQWDPTGGNNFVDIPNSAFSNLEPVNGLTMTGNGTLTLTNTNSYSGSTTIDGGTLVVTANGAMGPATALGIVVNGGGALALAGGLNYTTPEPITISGSGPAGNGAIESTGGTSAWAAPITLSGTSTIGSDAGAFTLGGDISAGSYSLTVIGAGATTLNGNITSQGGSVTLAAGGAINIAGNINLGSPGSLIDSGAGSATISGAISGSAGSVGSENELIKTGAGTLTLSNINTYSGPTIVSAGELVVTGHVLDSAITINAGATLGGDGTVAAVSVQSGGFLSPGDSPGTLTASSLSVAIGATFMEQLGGTSAGAQYDQTLIPAGGAVALDSPTLDIAFLGGFAPTVGQQFTLISNESGSGVSGTFSQGTMFTFDGYIFGINYSGGSGDDVVLTILGLTQSTTTSLSAFTTSGAPPDSSLAGQSVTFTATVTADTPASGTPNGTVIFEDGSSILGDVSLTNGSASFDTQALGAGNHTITADFIGTNGWINSVDSLTQTVSRDTSTTTIASSPAAATSVQPVTFTATVSPGAPGAGTPTGTVAFYVDGAPIGSSALEVVNGVPTAIFRDGTLSAGSYTIAAVYSGNVAFAAGNPVSANLDIGASAPAGGGGSSVPPTKSSGAQPPPQAPPQAQPQPPPQLTQAIVGTQTMFVLQFSEALDPTRAADLNNYAIFQADGKRLTILSAVYNPDVWTVTLHPKGHINLRHQYVLTVDGIAPVGLTSSSGVYLDGNAKGVAGNSAVRIVNGYKLVLSRGSRNHQPRFISLLARFASKSHPE